MTTRIYIYNDITSDQWGPILILHSISISHKGNMWIQILLFAMSLTGLQWILIELAAQKKQMSIIDMSRFPKYSLRYKRQLH